MVPPNKKRHQRPEWAIDALSGLMKCVMKTLVFCQRQKIFQVIYGLGKFLETIPQGMIPLGFGHFTLAEGQLQ
jgi:hypothetical protein